MRSFMADRAKGLFGGGPGHAGLDDPRGIARDEAAARIFPGEDRVRGDDRAVAETDALEDLHVAPDPAPLAEAMLKFADATRLRSFSAEARRRKDRYTLAGMADQTEEIYFDLVGYRVPALLRKSERVLEFQS